MAHIEPPILLTLCFVSEGDKVLLAMKKRGFGEGRWNGFGGKVQAGESLEEAAKRELVEESGLLGTKLDKRGIVHFEFADGTRPREVHAFKVVGFTGSPIETEEMRPQWFTKAEIPYTEMWAADALWLPTFFDGNKFFGRFVYDKPASSNSPNKVLQQTLLEVDDLEEARKL